MQVNPRWGQHIVSYLQKQEFPDNINKRRQKAIKIESREFFLIGNQLYKRGNDQQLWFCANEKEYMPILKQAHAEIGGGHFSINIIARAILMSGLWWPALFHNATAYVKSCNKYQSIKNPTSTKNPTSQCNLTTCQCVV